jgi:hypothetical protein
VATSFSGVADWELASAMVSANAAGLFNEAISADKEVSADA